MKLIKIDDDNYVRPATIGFVSVEQLIEGVYEVGVTNHKGGYITVKVFDDGNADDNLKAARKYLDEFVAKLLAESNG